MIVINDFAFCFLSQYDVDIERQECELTKLSDKFQIERWYRKDRNLSKYISFSQMINDAIDDTDSEFMIFCNPKTNFTSKDVEFMIDKLSNGYCFVSVVSFGFFGFSKELIRRVGMLDEKFIGAEFEDDDFAIRLSHFKKAVWWGYNYDKYIYYLSKSENLKHISYSIFNRKYKIVDKKIYINKDLFTHKKISKRHANHSDEIFNSWKDSSQSFGDIHYGEYLKNFETEIVDFNLTEKLTNFEIKIKKNISDFFVELLSENKFVIKIAILQNFNKGRTILKYFETFSNGWYKFNIIDPYDNQLYTDDVEIRIFIDDNQIYNNTLKEYEDLSLNFNIPVYVNN
jgi:hypothetical protein